MMTDTTFAVFEDFNEQTVQPAPAPIEEPPLPSAEIQTEAWTAGYLTGRSERSTQSADQILAAKLLTSVHELQASTLEASDTNSITVADLLLNTVIAMTSDCWSKGLLQHVRLVADSIKPALTARTEFLMKDDLGTTHCFEDISELSHALEAGSVGEDVSVRWQSGEARLSRAALLHELREAVGLLTNAGH